MNEEAFRTYAAAALTALLQKEQDTIVAADQAFKVAAEMVLAEREYLKGPSSGFGDIY